MVENTFSCQVTTFVALAPAVLLYVHLSAVGEPKVNVLRTINNLGVHSDLDRHKPIPFHTNTNPINQTHPPTLPSPQISQSLQNQWKWELFFLLLNMRPNWSSISALSTTESLHHSNQPFSTAIFFSKAQVGLASRLPATPLWNIPYTTWLEI